MQRWSRTLTRIQVSQIERRLRAGDSAAHLARVYQVTTIQIALIAGALRKKSALT